MTYHTMPENDDITILGGKSETTEKDWNDFWYEDGISLTGNPYYSPDSISITGSRIPGGMGDDHINFNTFNMSVPDLPAAPTNENGFWRYNEDVVLKEIRDYLSGTYRSHYASAESKTQTLDLIESVGDAEPFCRSNAIKYLSRFGKKNGKSKQDILKAIHYCILLYHFAGLCNENSQPYETF